MNIFTSGLKHLNQNINSKPEIFLMHGDKDAVVPINFLLEAKEFFNKNNYLFLGDIAISYERCLKEASVQNIQFNKHCCKLLAHAILHLLGYEHDVSVRTNRMQLMETRVLNSVLTNRPKLYNI